MKIETKNAAPAFAPVTVSFTFESKKELDEAATVIGRSTTGDQTAYDMYVALKAAGGVCR